MSKVTTLIVEDHHVLRQMLHEQLAAFLQVEVIGEAATPYEAIDKAKQLRPEVVLMDIELGADINGIQAGQTIRKRNPTVGIVLFSQHLVKEFITTPMAQSGKGWSYLLKKNVRDTNTLVRAIVGAAWGIVTIDSEIIDGSKPRPDTPMAKLSSEQLKILACVAKGYTDLAIANELSIGSVDLVDKKLNEIYKFLGIGRNGGKDARVMAVVAYLQQTRQNASYSVSAKSLSDV